MQVLQRLKFRNPIKIQHIRNGKVIGEYDIFNGVTTEGVNHLLDVTFDGATANANWYIGLVDNAGFSAFADADTMASHGGWSESTAYGEATRVEWAPAAAASRSISNTVTVDFTINTTVTIKGVFITSVSTKSGTTGVLWATAAFSTAVPLVNADILKVTYAVSA